jgi:hypothetical protein
MNWRAGVCACAIGALGLTSCGGGGGGSAVGALLLLIFVGPSNGSLYIDDSGAPGVQLRLCEDESGSEVACTIRIQAIDPSDPGSVLPWSNFYKVSFDIRASSNIEGCNNISGTIEEDVLTLSGCFSGRFENVNEVVDGDGRRLLLDVKPDLTSGVWLDVDNPTRRYVFESDDGTLATGCEKTVGGTAPARASITRSDVLNGVLTSVNWVEIDRGGAAAERWSAEMVGVSGLRLQREGETRSLVRRDLDDDCS